MKFNISFVLGCVFLCGPTADLTRCVVYMKIKRKLNGALQSQLKPTLSPNNL